MKTKTYIIGYDLNKIGQNYSELIEAIKNVSNGTWWHHLDSTFIIKSNKSALSIKNTLSKYIDCNDELFIARLVEEETEWAGFSKRGTEWLENQLAS